jgi:hypothetical protein
MLRIFGEDISTEVLRAAWPCLWDTSKKGNPYLKTDAFSVAVYPSAHYGAPAMWPGKVSATPESGDNRTRNVAGLCELHVPTLRKSLIILTRLATARLPSSAGGNERHEIWTRTQNP